MKRPDRTPAQRRAWRHNASIGSVVWAIKALTGISGTDTITDETRKQISLILYELHRLRNMLATRKDD